MRLRFLLLVVLAAASPGWARNAVDFTLPDSDGRQVTLSNYRGKYVLLEFMLTTCPHCQAAGKALEKLQQEFPTQLQVLAITMPGILPAVLSEYKQNFGVTYPVLQGSPKVMMDYWGFNGLGHVPGFILVDPGGRIIQERNPDRPADRYFYENPNAAKNPAETGDVYLMKSVDKMIRDVMPQVRKGKGTSKKSAKKSGAAHASAQR